MPEVRIAQRAAHLAAQQAHAEVGFLAQVFLGYGGPEAGPAGSRFELALGVEQSRCAVRTAEDPGAVFGGAGCAACGTGCPGVLPCSGRFGSYGCAAAGAEPESVGGATFATNGVGARVM